MVPIKDVLVGIPVVDAQQWDRIAGFTRWLIAARASVLPLTLFAVTFALCLAQPHSLVQWVLALTTGLALLLAHATNNLINDYVDHKTGVDRGNYFRVQYGVHVLESGLVSSQQFLRYIIWTGFSALLLGVGVCWYVGGVAPWFALAGGFFVLCYTYPLKRIALGELAVFLVWGPLMVVGTFFVVNRYIALDVVLVSIIYGLGPTVVILAKHTDKAPHDREKKILTFPVVLGAWARHVVAVALIMQFVLALAAAMAFALYGLAGIALALPAAVRCIRVLQLPAPAACPSDYPAQAWPLWYTTFAFRFARDAGLGLTLGVLLQNLLN
ncbi:MAG: prenyltransferase [bacterium]